MKFTFTTQLIRALKARFVRLLRLLPQLPAMAERYQQAGAKFIFVGS